MHSQWAESNDLRVTKILSAHRNSYLAYVAAAAASRWLMVRSIWAGGNSLRGVLRGAVQSAGDVDDPPRAPAHDFKGAGGDIAKGFASKC